MHVESLPSRQNFGVPQKIVMLVNPVAGKGRGIKAAATAAAVIREQGHILVEQVGSSARHLCELAEQSKALHPDLFLVVGGDGTVGALLEVLIQGSVPLGLIPAGTGNDLARSMGIPHETTRAREAAELALAGSVRHIDVCQAWCNEGTAKFVTVAALGFDANVAVRTNKMRWPKGRSRYYLALLIELIRLRPIPFAISVDGQMFAATGILVAIANIASYGGGMRISPQADPSDGQLDVVHVGPISRSKLIRLFPLLIRAQHVTRPEVTVVRGARFEISAPGLTVLVDGERIGTERVRIEVLPQTLGLRV